MKDEKGEYTYLENGQNIAIKGVDVSKYQETIDWKKVAADGVEFAIIRLGFRGMGTQGTCELDPYFKQNVEGAKAAGIEVGVYFFTQATTVEEAKEEAKFVIDNLKGDYQLQSGKGKQVVSRGPDSLYQGFSGRDRGSRLYADAVCQYPLVRFKAGYGRACGL